MCQRLYRWNNFLLIVPCFKQAMRTDWVSLIRIRFFAHVHGLLTLPDLLHIIHRHEEDSLDSSRRSSSTGLMNFSQSCVPLGTIRSSCSATTIPSTYDCLVLLRVVMKSEPPGCRQREKGVDLVHEALKMYSFTGDAVSDSLFLHLRHVSAEIARRHLGHWCIYRTALELLVHENRKLECQASGLNLSEHKFNKRGGNKRAEEMERPILL